MQVNDALHLTHRRINILTGISKFSQVAAEDLDGDLSPHARHDVVQAMRNRLTNIGLNAWDGRDSVADVRQNFLTRSSGCLESPQMCNWN